MKGIAPCQAIGERLAEAYPRASCSLLHRNAYELLVATVLSAQCTDERVNRVTPPLFACFPDASSLAAADPQELEGMIRSTGCYRNKAKSLLGAARMIVTEHGGEIPGTMEELVRLPGVARKTANVVLGNVFGKSEGVVVDTHVARLAARLGFSSATTAEKIESDLMKEFRREDWVPLSHRLIEHGRRVCAARRPACELCPLEDLCPRIGV
ncbi:MAG: endonuclease III [Acidobacteriota bacterium]